MVDLPPGITRVALEIMVGDLNLRLILDPDLITPRFERACALEALGEFDEAKREYRDVFRRDPGHFGALNNLGLLLYRQGFWRSARLAYEAAVARHPGRAVGYANLAQVLLVQGKGDEAVAHYERSLALDPKDSVAHHGLAHILFERGDDAAAKEHQAHAFRTRPVSFSAYLGSAEPVRILMLGASGPGNIPAEKYFDYTTVLVATIIVDFWEPSVVLPPHHLVFNVVGDADLCRPQLVTVDAVLQQTQAPLINRPTAVMATGRAANSERLAGIPGVLMPKVAIFPRSQMARVDAAVAQLSARGFTFPLLIRSPGFHTGENFERVDDPTGLTAAVKNLPGDTLMAIEYIDARGADGKARKYRVMMIDGKLYPLHLAISDHWKVHYFSADMAENVRNRAEDERFLNDMEEVLGPVAIAAIERIRDALGLDYAGIDFGIAPDGRVIFFEANATMIVPDPPPGDEWNYRRPPVLKIVRAIRALFERRAREGGYPGPALAGRHSENP